MSEAELFDHYLQGMLKSAERNKFEAQLQSDPGFAHRFKLHKEVDRAILQADLMDFRSKLDSIQVDHTSIMETNREGILNTSQAFDFEEAILQQDIMALRDQLNLIHAGLEEEVDASEIPGYQSIEHAIIQKDSVQLREGLSAFNARQGFDGLSDEERLHIEVDTAISQGDVMVLRDKLHEIGDRMDKPARQLNSSKRIRTTISYAAAAVLVLSLILTPFVANRNISPEKASFSMFEAYDAGGYLRGAQNDKVDSKRTAMKKYREADYLNAYEFLQLADKSDHEVIFFLGMTSFLINETDEATSYFMEYGATGESAFRDAAEFYLAGCYLRQNKTDEAKKILEKIVSSDKHDHKADAQLVLAKVKF